MRHLNKLCAAKTVVLSRACEQAICGLPVQSTSMVTLPTSKHKICIFWGNYDDHPSISVKSLLLTTGTNNGFCDVGITQQIQQAYCRMYYGKIPLPIGVSDSASHKSA